MEKKLSKDEQAALDKMEKQIDPGIIKNLGSRMVPEAKGPWIMAKVVKNDIVPAGAESEFKGGGILEGQYVAFSVGNQAKEAGFAEGDILITPGNITEFQVPGNFDTWAAFHMEAVICVMKKE